MLELKLLLNPEEFKDFFIDLTTSQPYLLERTKIVIRERFELSNQEIANRYGVSRQRIDQLHRSAILLMMKKLYKDTLTRKEIEILTDKVRRKISYCRRELKAKSE